MLTEVKRALVTGAAGFVGFHLSKKLLASGFAVLGVDSLDPYYSTELKNERIGLLRQYSGFTFEKVDIAQDQEFQKLTKSFQPQTIFHLAAQAGVRLKIEDYDRYINSNLVGFSKVAIAAKENKIENFIYASSSSVYGNLEKDVFSEAQPNLKPVSFYGATKLSNELLSLGLFAGEKTRTRGLRFFTVYGEYGRPDMAYFRILASLINNSQFQVFGDGEDLRDFTYIDDVVDSIFALNLDLSDREPGFIDIVNIGGGTPRSLNEMIAVMETLTGKELKRSIGLKIHADVNKTIADSEYLRSILGAIPSVSMEEGLEKFVSWGLANPSHFLGK
jgi:UDP-glucuronate 4-epimerase